MPEESLNKLTPIVIKECDPQHKAVKQLSYALEEQGVYNIAITGTYGSGKSSIIETYLHENSNAKDKCCRISLSTIEALNNIKGLQCQDSNTPSVKNNLINNTKKETPNDANSKKEHTCKEDDIKLNRRIEYSLLQQLIYKEGHEKLPKSRFKKIPYITKEKTIWYTVWIISCILCWLIVFEPKAFRVDSLYTFFETYFGIWNFIFDCIASLWLIFSTGCLVYHLIRTCTGISLKKLSIPNAEINIDGDKSVFNDYLEEIIYFFQETGYTVVFIEDLDRFDSTHIFLKLRELNNILNNSHMITKKIRFVYAIKDDLFVDSGRTKFFDKIIPVIPIINPSNAATKLMESLKELGIEVNVEDLKDMAYFIKDMRLLKNIANEFAMYYNMLEAKKNHLDPAKLMGMMIYKNLYPHDFGLLPDRKGILYKVLSKESKEKFLMYAKENIISGRKKELFNEKEAKLKTQEHNLTELRKLYLFKVHEQLPYLIYDNITLKDNKSYSFDDIAEREELFSLLMDSTQISYHNYEYGNPQKGNIDFKKIEKTVDNQFSYKERAKSLSENSEDIDKKLRDLDLEEQRINSYRIKDIFIKFPELTTIEEYRDLHIPYMIEFFLKRGYLDENYYDYISYFYKGISTDKDHDTLMKLKSSLEVKYNQSIDDIKGFMQELPRNLYSSDVCLINAIYDYVLDHPSICNIEKDLLLAHLNKSQKALEFLQQYLNESIHSDNVFKSYVNHDPKLSWKQFITCSKPEDMIREWLKVINMNVYPNVQNAINWVNKNYTFILENIDFLSKERSFEIADEAQFEALEETDSPLLSYVNDYDLYVINKHNLLVLTDYYNKKESITESNLNLTKILNTSNESLINYIESNIDKSIPLFSTTIKDEEETALLFILNNEKLSEETKQEYLSAQKNKIKDANKIKEDIEKNLALKSNIVSPTWQNICIYIPQNQRDYNIIESFIANNVGYLSNTESAVNIKGTDQLFERYINSTNIANDRIYQQILKAFHGYIIKEQINQGLNDNRLNLLIKEGFIPYSDQYKGQLKTINDQSYGNYLLHYWMDFSKVGLKSTDFTTGSVLILLNSPKLSIIEKQGIMKEMPPELFQINTVATTIGKLLTQKFYFLNYRNLYRIISNCTDEPTKIKVAISTIQYNEENDQEYDVVINVINQLGSKYKELLDLNKHPLLKNTALNKELLNLLIQQEIISSYKKEEKKGLRVYPKRI